MIEHWKIKKKKKSNVTENEKVTLHIMAYIM